MDFGFVTLLLVTDFFRTHSGTSVRRDDEQALRYAVILMDYADETKQDYDELLIERNKSGGYWLHFAVRPKDNRRKTMFLQV